MEKCENKAIKSRRIKDYFAETAVPRLSTQASNAARGVQRLRPAMRETNPPSPHAYRVKVRKQTHLLPENQGVLPRWTPLRIEV